MLQAAPPSSRKRTRSTWSWTAMSPLSSPAAHRLRLPPSLYPSAHVDRILHDGSTVRLATSPSLRTRRAGHTRGCTTWTMHVHLPEPASLATSSSSAAGTSTPSYRLVAPRPTRLLPRHRQRLRPHLRRAQRPALRHLPRRARLVLRPAREACAHAAGRRQGLDRS